jgi:chloramphenicol 3-O-phosphotransferase
MAEQSTPLAYNVVAKRGDNVVIDTYIKPDMLGKVLRLLNSEMLTVTHTAVNVLPEGVELGE